MDSTQCIRFPSLSPLPVLLPCPPPSILAPLLADAPPAGIVPLLLPFDFGEMMSAARECAEADRAKRGGNPRQMNHPREPEAVVRGQSPGPPQIVLKHNGHVEDTQGEMNEGGKELVRSG
jgi:hypothetical protein